MHPAIETRHDRIRGCGWRSPGGLYLVSDGIAAPCGRLPIPLETCPTCSSGIKPARGWTWVDGRKLAEPYPCKPEPDHHPVCGMANPVERVGLIWIGVAYYARPNDFIHEASELGVSRRIPAVPRGFKLGETWVWLAHRNCILDGDPRPFDPDWSPEYTAGVFQVFEPSAIEYVCKGDETDEKLDTLVRHGVTPIQIKRIGGTREIFAPGGNGNGTG